MRSTVLMAVGLALGSALSACASSEVVSGESYIGEEEIAQPDQIFVYDFFVLPEDIPATSAITGHFTPTSTPETAEEIELARQLGARVADGLTEQLLAMGLDAVREDTGQFPGEGDLVITGQFVSIDEGDRLRRMLVGFGAGAANLKTFVEIYQVTDDELRPLGVGEVEAGGGSMPGMLVTVGAGAAAGAAATAAGISGGSKALQELGPEGIDAAADRTAATIAGQLRQQFERRGWI